MSVLGSDPDVPVSELLFELPIQECSTSYSGGNAAEANFRSNFGVPVLPPPQERFMRFTGIS